ncbi:phosphoglycolate phosphatase, bacterial [Sulfuriferula plumbiphila]|uniref:Phosphoglycolate phosphatase n=1 Tax=Sulfuriferula plumbiphila TaxID=171865 RepID=A0A512LAA5_9PROT|nr:phosphoglycolate phosphatase [Sulfuriferula plumbiphila]BBP03116.1 phosphoglycolate phosphatase, bacterial [Sulfuriferula plumbiphila]GEP31416.1 phosphoglycolate phosphatase, bacterial [Sulfuriferula plumbiphila]
MNFPIKIRAVVIDLDGTLLDTAPDLAHAAELMMAELGLPPVPLATIKTYIGNGVARLVKRVLTGSMDAEPDATLFARAYPIYQKHYGAHVSLHSRPFPGVVEGLQALRAMGLHVACITNKAEVFTLPLLRDTGLLDYFELVLSGDTLPKRKPDPLPLLHACRHFDVEPGELLLIGDSLNDTQAARAAGSPVFCVPYGYNRGRPVAELDQDAVVPSLLEAAQLITKA